MEDPRNCIHIVPPFWKIPFGLDLLLDGGKISPRTRTQFLDQVLGEWNQFLDQASGGWKIQYPHTVIQFLDQVLAGWTIQYPRTGIQFLDQILGGWKIQHPRTRSQFFDRVLEDRKVQHTGTQLRLPWAICPVSDPLLVSHHLNVHLSNVPKSSSIRSQANPTSLILSQANPFDQTITHGINQACSDLTTY